MKGIKGGNISVLTQERLKELLHYDPETGVFRWKVDRNRVKSGDLAGNQRATGYVKISVCSRYYPAHHLAWLYVYGYLPISEVDHKDGDPSNNRILNLREATHLQNQQNRKLPRNNTSGHQGVTWCKRTSRWRVHIRDNGKRRYLGTFIELEDAARAREDGKRKYHTFQLEDRN